MSTANIVYHFKYKDSEKTMYFRSNTSLNLVIGQYITIKMCDDEWIKGYIHSVNTRVELEYNTQHNILDDIDEVYYYVELTKTLKLTK